MTSEERARILRVSLGEVLCSPHGRLVLSQLLDEFGLTNYAKPEADLAYFNGQRSAAVIIHQKILECDRQAYILMLREYEEFMHNEEDDNA